MLDLTYSQTCQELFGSTPRQIGPIQRSVTSYPELVSQMTAQSGIMNSFVSVYSFYPFMNPVIDKIFLENEWKNPATALSIGQSIFQECREKYNLPTIPIWSGNRSPHIFPLFQPTLVDNPSEIIKKVAYKIIYTSDNYCIDPISYKKIPYIDTKVLEPRRLCRFPNTRRSTPSGTPSPNHCIILDPERFPDMSISEVTDLSKSPQNYKIKIPVRNKKITDIPTHEISFDEWTGTSESFTSPISMSQDPTSIETSSLEFILDKLISRPCTRKGMSFPNPSHIIRQNFVAELRMKGASQEFVNFIFSLISPFDFDNQTTAYHINKIYQKKFYPHNYKTLNDSGLCFFDSNNTYCNKCKRYGH